ncbi:MAG: amidohydrolase [Lewinella sp.]|nr:amidohydrolase [Lewinella sp.]
MRPLFFLSIIICCGACQPSQPTPDRIYTNAIIWTGDPDQPRAEALAITDGVITAVGSAAEIETLQGDRTEVVDLGGRFMVPGFIDNHTHFLSGGHQLASVNLRTARTPAEFIQAMQSYVDGLTTEGWITGGDWDHEAWGGELPRRAWIDSVAGDHPVFVSRLDGHMALANSKALKLAGITAATPDVEGGTIVRDEQGEPTGILKDEAMGMVYRVMPDPSEAELDAKLARAAAHALSLGLTQVHDVGSYGGWADLATYRRAEKRGELPLRIYAFVPISTWPRMASYANKFGRGDDLLRWGGLKGFVDGSLGSTTAWFYDPYTDEPETAGFTVTDTADLHRWIVSADSAGLHLAIHAIGDRANDWLLDVFAEAAARNGEQPFRRFRIEHAQHLTRAAIPRFAAQNVIPSMQPYHAIDDGRWAEKRIGPERILTTYAFRSLLDAGAPLTFGSDWTVAPLSPLEGIYAAVTRRTLDGANPDGWVPREKITVEEALRCYTSANAYAGFQEDKVGRLQTGMLADFTVLSDNLLEIAPESIPEVKVILTVVGGEARYGAPAGGR